jgi:hypothetical protein
MKKLLFLIIMTMSFMTMAQQPNQNDVVRWVTNQIVEESSGYISQELEDSKGDLVLVISYPEHYDFELVRLVWRAFIIQYNDIETVYAWGIGNDPQEFFTVIKIGGKYEVLVSYHTKTKQSIVFNPPS